ncbi:MAG: 50S ribosomal protein L22 [Bacteroidetes bacterium]|nr:50S ribosomal protein L22 [Bacteroidota bacterium]
MGSRKKNRAEKLKEERTNKYMAVLKNCPTSPRKMRLVADMIRGEDVNKALDMLKYSPKEASRKVEKLLLSAIANWQNKNEGARVEESNLFIKELFVDSGRVLKRIRPAPQGRAHRIRKRSNHVTMILGSLNLTEELSTNNK